MVHRLKKDATNYQLPTINKPRRRLGFSLVELLVARHPKPCSPNVALAKLGRRKATLGFSLVELLVVIAILGVLASITSFTLVGHQKKARDAQRKNDLQQIARAMQSAKNDCAGNGAYYPTDGALGLFANLEGGRYTILVNHLANTNLKYLNNAIYDPQVNGGVYYYRFARPTTPVTLKCVDNAGTPLNWSGIDKYVIRAQLEQGNLDKDAGKSEDNCSQTISDLSGLAENAGGFNSSLVPGNTDGFYYVCSN